MMSPPMQLTTSSGVPFTPTSDALDRHEYGITKNRKLAASTGGGRAWSEDEVSEKSSLCLTPFEAGKHSEGTVRVLS